MMYTGQTERDGRVLVDNMFTTSPQDGRFLMIGLALTGALQRVVPLPDPVVWHGLRIIVLALFCLVLWKLCATIFGERWKSAAAFTFVLFAGGLDWIVRPLWRDWFAQAGYPWANFIDNPWNFSVFFASTNLVWAIPMTVVTAAILSEIRLSRAFAAARDSGGKTPGTTSLYLRGLLRGLVFAILWFIHPYSALAWGVTVIVSAFVPQPGLAVRRSIASNVPAAIGPAIAGAFILWSQQDAVAAACNAQTGLWKLNYPIYLYPIVYGPWMLLPLALLRRPSQMDRSSMRWLLIWLGTALLLTVNPMITGAKFQVAMAVPLMILEAAGLFAIVDRLARTPGTRRLAIPATAMFIAIASANSAASLVIDVAPPAARAATRTSASHLRQLGQLAVLPDGGVLCDPMDAVLVPWKAGKPVFVGHWFLSTRYMEKADLVRWFYSGTGTAEQLAGFLNAAGIRWVLYGPREKTYGPMPSLNGLSLRSDADGRQIWEWKPGE